MRFQTMKSVRIQIVSLLLAGLISMPAHAGMIPGRWEKVSDLDLGTPITVELKNGDQVEGDFEGLSESGVDIETHSARAIIPRADIQTITARKMGGRANGATVGAAIGAAISFIGIATGRASGSGHRSGALLLGTLLTTGLGAAIGAGIGAAAGGGTEREAIVVYKAPGSPSASVNWN